MQEHEFFKTNIPAVLAHRGGSTKTENTIEAFKEAISNGADIIETDVRTTKDNIAIVFHDKDLLRVANDSRNIADTTYSDLRKIQLHGGGQITTLLEALTTLPQAKFNLDIKDANSVKTAAEVIEATHSHNRVLVSSFSEKRRLETLGLLSEAVATSASARKVITLLAIHLFRLPQSVFNKVLVGIGALQIPRKMFGIRLDSKSFILKVKSSNTQLHYWTINDPKEMIELAGLGATGIVTDVSELAVQTLRKA